MNKSKIFKIQWYLTKNMSLPYDSSRKCNYGLVVKILKEKSKVAKILLEESLGK